MEMDIICKENIKPATPTPHHLSIHKLSYLDQLCAHAYLPFLLFYPNDQTAKLNSDVISGRRLRLKQSLSETLARFYPLAGEFKGDLHFYCNDNGVYYVEARVNSRLSDILRKPETTLLHQLLPYHPSSDELLAKTFVVMIQVNIFNCGGMAIGSYTSHKLLDGYSIMTFWKAWATTARGSSEQIYPGFISSHLFPLNPALPKNGSLVMWPSLYHRFRCVPRRFVFDTSALNALKAKATVSSAIKTPSRVVAVIGLVWKCVMAAAEVRSGFRKPSIMSVAVNLRRKHSPALPNYTIGNIIWFALAEYAPEMELKLGSVIECLQEAIDKIDTNFTQQLKGEKGSLNMSERLEELKTFYSNNDAEYYVASSLCNEGLYEVDFGWGKPTWIGHGGADIDNPGLTNLIFLMDSNSSGGIEALVSLNERDMSILEHDSELLAFASVNPSPLESNTLVHGLSEDSPLAP